RPGVVESDGAIEGAAALGNRAAAVLDDRVADDRHPVVLAGDGRPVDPLRDAVHGELYLVGRDRLVVAPKDDAAPVARSGSGVRVVVRCAADAGVVVAREIDLSGWCRATQHLQRAALVLNKEGRV